MLATLAHAAAMRDGMMPHPTGATPEPGNPQ